jgi:hypothetical protein
MRKIQAGLIAAGAALVVAEWLILSHSLAWVLTSALPR